MGYSRQELKAQWLQYSAYKYHPKNRWLLERVASLYDLSEPTERQAKIVHMADLQLTLADLPSGAHPTHDQELRALCKEEFGDPPEIQT